MLYGGLREAEEKRYTKASRAASTDRSMEEDEFFMREEQSSFENKNPFKRRSNSM